MQVQIQKTDKGLVIPIPEDLVRESNFDQDSMVDITLQNGKLVVADPADPYYALEELLEGITEENRHPEISAAPIRRSKYTTEELLTGVTDDNIHGETDWGPPVGKEVW